MSEKKSTAGRKPIDVVMFWMLVLQSLYNLSNEQWPRAGVWHGPLIGEHPSPPGTKRGG